MKFGEYLKFLREKYALTLRDVEEKSGVSNAYLSQLERGLKTSPHPDILKKLAPVYQVSLSELMIKAGYFQEELDFEERREYRIKSDPTAAYIFRGYEKLTDAGKETLKKYVAWLEHQEEFEEQERNKDAA